MDEVQHGERHGEDAEEDVRQGHVGYQDVPGGFEELKQCSRVINLYNSRHHEPHIMWSKTKNRFSFLI